MKIYFLQTGYFWNAATSVLRWSSTFGCLRGAFLIFLKALNCMTLIFLRGPWLGISNKRSEAFWTTIVCLRGISQCQVSLGRAQVNFETILNHNVQPGRSKTGEISFRTQHARLSLVPPLESLRSCHMCCKAKSKTLQYWNLLDFVIASKSSKWIFPSSYVRVETVGKGHTDTARFVYVLNDHQHTRFLRLSIILPKYHHSV